MRKEDIPNPNLVTTILSGIIFILKSKLNNSKAQIPNSIGKYQLVKILKNDPYFNNYSVGEYTYNDQSYFIKTWRGKIKDLNYYSLINEYKVNNILFRYLSKSTDKISVPQPIDLIYGKNSVSIVLTFLKGKTLNTFSTDKQAEVIKDILTELKNVTNHLSDKDMKIFSKRGFTFYISLLPFITIAAVLSDFKNTKLYITSSIKSVNYLWNIRHKKLVLCHRDLLPENIMIQNEKIYILDSERAVLTYDNYDLYYLSLNHDNLNLYKKVVKRNIKLSNIFLKYFICLHLVSSYSNLPDLKDYVIEVLKNIA